ncbi:MAG TPA: hypothetical protein VNU92_05400 [Edaphobacter sp.]|nr:hypothetical protein [Edaphobacter sp.]
MSESTFCIILTIVIAGIFFAWVPFLNVICPSCSRFLERRRNQKNAAAERPFLIKNSIHTHAKTVHRT